MEKRMSTLLTEPPKGPGPEEKHTSLSEQAVHRRSEKKQKSGAAGMSAALAAVCIFLIAAICTTDLQAAAPSAAAESADEAQMLSAGNDEQDSALDAESGTVIKTVKQPEIDHLPGHHRSKHSKKDLVYDPPTEEELEVQRQAEEEAKRIEELNTQIDELTSVIQDYTTKLEELEKEE